MGEGRSSLHLDRIRPFPAPAGARTGADGLPARAPRKKDATAETETVPLPRDRTPRDL